MKPYADRPYVICHMLTSLDGKIDGSFFSAEETYPALKKYSELRKFYDCPATLYGTTTMAQGYADGIEKLLLAGGGLMNGSFLQAELIDELSLVLAPTADGSRTTASLFEKPEFLPPSPPAAFHLTSVERIEEDTLWLRYLLK